ncbi:hypothetical protein BGW36DRAFT_341050 [Talaromyces proteolyticus]|uniref:Signal peptidase complex catalytic subunit SEC11 n=1 Tax=Talaromyces proteolyticus TaxID=1131652 RepID=A0AAD4KUN8_9EURO|nr:uncharacterized protein BGW36DRAFT_341050 [Talaromyces proteolyticus]KAH8697146.1 hypothetical protein BGW36DRAFT_341050 [Talaromyces proteolyticus]
MQKFSLLSSLFPIMWHMSSVFMLWKAQCVITGSPDPLMVVTSQSMEPAFQPGDLIFLWNRNRHIQAGEIPVVWFSDRPLPMMHRAIKVSSLPGSDGQSKQLILTKGENNVIDDVALYPGGRPFVYREEIVGVVRGYLPGVGWVALALKAIQQCYIHVVRWQWLFSEYFDHSLVNKIYINNGSSLFSAAYSHYA